MTHPGATLAKRENGSRANGRFRLFMLVVAVAAIAAIYPSAASAEISSTIDQTFESNVAGANSTYTNVQTMTTTTGAGQTDDDDLRKWILDGPAGQIGNPNAIPFDDRCTLAEFNTTIDPGSDGLPPFFNGCPAASNVGVAAVLLGIDANNAAADGNGAAPDISAFAGINPSFADNQGMTGGNADVYTNGTPGSIYVLQTTPEVPLTLATHFHLTNSRTQSVLQPVTSGTDGDFRIRVIPADDSAHPVTTGPTPLHIKKIMQRLHAKNGVGETGSAWLFNPTRCDTWTGFSYVREYDPAGNTNANSNPDIENPADGYVKSTGSDIAPDCSTLPAFPASATMTLSSLARGSNPQVDVEVKGINAMGDDFPKSVVTTMPASITTDVQGIATPCEIADRNANACPASSKVGSATATTPLLTAGLSGDVYMIRGEGGKAVPDLAIFFNNPPNSIRPFRLDGTTKFVGPNNNQIETTFAQAPQNPVSSFKLTIDGGTAAKPDSLLTISVCPSDTASPPDGPITFNITGFSGQTATNSSVPALEDCFGIRKLKSISKCVKSKLKVSPGYQSRDQIQKSELWIKYKERARRNGKMLYKWKRVKTSKSSPFRFNQKLSAKKFNKGTYRYKVRAVYKPSTNHPSPYVTQQYSKFKYCGK